MSVYAAYAFSEGGGTTIYDYSGNGRNMTVTGTASWPAGQGTYATAYQSGATASDGASWDAGSAQAALSGDVSMQMWCKHTGGTSTTACHAGGLYSAASTARLAAYTYRSLGGVAGSPEFTIRDSASTIISVADTATTGDSANWHNFAIVYHSTGTMDVYLDGVLVSAASSVTTTNPIGLFVRFIGVGDSISGQSVNAAVQDMRVFDAALTGANVVTWMNTPVVPQFRYQMRSAF